jgi:hypothetical protein
MQEVHIMKLILNMLVFIGVLWSGNAIAFDPIKSAMSAAPESISANAAVVDWNLQTLREGSNGWTCLPDNQNTPGVDPWCVNEPWLNFLQAYIKKEKPTYTGVGIAYMLMGDTPVSNSDPYATEPTGKDNDWVTDLGAHLMVLVTDQDSLKQLSTDHTNGGPWVMWPDTPYAHIMVPVVNRMKM